MVMQMSRIERKKTEKKRKRFFKLFIILEIIILISGLILVDLSTRQMIGLEQNFLIGYEKQDFGESTIYLMGDKHNINTDKIYRMAYKVFAEFREIAYNTKEWLKNKTKFYEIKMSVNRHFF